MVFFDKKIDMPLEGYMQVWEEPKSKQSYVIGADVAEGLEHGDFSCAHVLNTATGEQAAVWHGHMDPDLFGEQLDMVGRWYNNALIGVEANNHGGTTIAALRRRKYPRLFRRRTVGNISTKMQDQYGWFTSRVTKPYVIDKLGAALREDSLTLHDELTLGELRSFIREYTTGGGVKMHGSPHDDRVMALAIAVEMLEHIGEYPDEAPQAEIGTFDYYVQQALDYEKQSKGGNGDPTLIGRHNVRETRYR